MIDRGFEAMIPRSPVKEEESEDFNYSITVPLFGKVLSLTIQIKPRSKS